MEKQMTDEEIRFIKFKASGLAHWYNVDELERIVNIMTRIEAVYKDLGLGIVIVSREEQYPYKLDISTLLEDAFVCLTPYRALDYLEKLENDELQALIMKCTFIKFILNKMTPFYTRLELAEQINRFSDYLRNNELNLLTIGYPQKSFESSFWLYDNLARLYPIKIPDIERENKRFVGSEEPERDSQGNRIFRFDWLKRKIGADGFICCSYEESPLINGFEEDDAKEIIKLRPKIQELKIKILEIAKQHLTTKTGTSFFDDCCEFIANCLLGELENINRIESQYKDILFFPGFGEDSYIIIPNLITGFSRDLKAGGINNIMDFVAFVEQELTIGRINKIKTKLLKVVENFNFRSYFDLIFLPTINKIDNTILELLTDSKAEIDMIKNFDNRLMTQMQKINKKPLLIRNDIYDTIAKLANLFELNNNSGFEFVLRNKLKYVGTRKREIISLIFSCSHKWEDVTIIFLNGHDVRIVVKGEENPWDLDYNKMGFRNNDTRNPDLQWKLLIELAENEGKKSLKRRTIREKNRIKQQIKKIKDNLMAIFNINESAFDFKNKVYKIRITLIPESQSKEYISYEGSNWNEVINLNENDDNREKYK